MARQNWNQSKNIDGYVYQFTDSGELIGIDNFNGTDVNGDTIINILDIVLIVSFILITNEPTDSEFSSADINSDELLNVLDIVEIVQMILNPIQLNFSDQKEVWLLIGVVGKRIHWKLKT